VSGRPSHRVLRACAAALDGLQEPHGYDANIVLVNRIDRKAHVFVGRSDPRDLQRAIADLIEDQDQVGIVNRNGVELEI
jgi:hypothetical protein